MDWHKMPRVSCSLSEAQCLEGLRKYAPSIECEHWKNDVDYLLWPLFMRSFFFPKDNNHHNTSNANHWLIASETCKHTSGEGSNTQLAAAPARHCSHTPPKIFISICPNLAWLH